eukprot:COSAG02_NODE_37_length_48203_cov_57.745708_22_plen_556_part_00
MSYLIRGCLLPKGGVGADQGYATADVLISDGFIVQVTSPATCTSTCDESRSGADFTVVDGTNKLLLPGLHNAHTHSNNFFAKGALAPLPLEMMVATRVGLPADHPSQPQPSDDELVRRYRVGACMTGLSTLLSGGTSLIDMITLPDTGDEELAMRCLKAAADGYRSTGIRCFLGPHLNDSAEGTFTANFMGMPPPGCVLPPGLTGLGEDGSPRIKRPDMDPARTTAALAFWRRAISELHQTESERLSIILAPHNETTCSKELFAGAAEIMAEHEGVFGTTHLLEGLHQPLSSSQRYGDAGIGSSAANYRGADNMEVHGTVTTLDGTGFLGAGTTLAHGVHLSGGDMALLAARGCTVSHNPISNLRLGAGIANLPAMLSAGVNVGLGVDGSGSGVDSQDILEVTKFASLIHNPSTAEYRDWPSPKQIFDLGCRCGKKAVTVGVDAASSQVGRIEVGAVADCVLYDLDAFSLLPHADPIVSLVLSSARPTIGGSQVHTVFVGGERVVAEGAHASFDIEKLKTEILDLQAEFYSALDVPDNSSYAVEYRAGLGLPQRL